MMHLSQTNTKDFDLLIFRDRNQAYGAYALRKDYSSRTLKSLLIGVAIIASILAIPYLSKLFQKETVVDHYIPPPIIEMTNVDDKKDPPLPMDNPPPPSGNTREFFTPVISMEDMEDSATTMDDLALANPGKTNSYGDPGEWGWPEDNGEGRRFIGDSSGTDELTFFTDPPEFPGGDDAMRDFLGNNLVYPEHARQIHQEGTVHVTFTVDQFGNIAKVSVPREIGGGLDEEAMRVVKMMPRWNPGRQNGRPVKVQFHLPIIFKLD